MKKYLLFIFACCLNLFFANSLMAKTSFNKIDVTPNKIELHFNKKVTYKSFYLTKPNRLVIDLLDTQISPQLQRTLPLKNPNSAVGKIRMSKPLKKNSYRLVFELKQPLKAKFSLKANKKDYILSVNLNAKNTVKTKPIPKIVVVIDAGHGGSDTGAIGRFYRTYEKNITLSIARYLKSFFDKDSRFDAQMIRSKDTTINVSKRSGIARDKKANFLISIHADSNPNQSSRGASIYVLSGNRAKRELNHWLDDHLNDHELLNGMDIIKENSDVKFLDKTILDLQFSHSTKVSYELSNEILNQLKPVTGIFLDKPRHASLSVLTAPDFPSILIETGLLTNKADEKLLRSSAHQRKIAKAIYDGMVKYYTKNIYYLIKPQNIKTKISKQSNFVEHKIKAGDTLTQIALKYTVDIDSIKDFNDMKNDTLITGKTIKIPLINKSDQQNTKQNTKVIENKPSPKHKNITHKVVAGETLSSIARKYKLSVSALKNTNKLKNNTIFIGQKLKIEQ